MVLTDIVSSVKNNYFLTDGKYSVKINVIENGARLFHCHFGFIQAGLCSGRQPPAVLPTSWAPSFRGEGVARHFQHSPWTHLVTFLPTFRYYRIVRKVLNSTDDFFADNTSTIALRNHFSIKSFTSCFRSIKDNLCSRGNSMQCLLYLRKVSLSYAAIFPILNALLDLSFEEDSEELSIVPLASSRIGNNVI